MRLRGPLMISLAAISGCGVPGCYHPATVATNPPLSGQVARPVPGFARMAPPRLDQKPLPTLDLPRGPAVTGNPWKPKVAARDWQYIVIHHTATQRGSVESIHEAHLSKKDKNGNPWLGIGYHFVIGNGNGMEDGAIEETFRWRQQMHGAHAGVDEYNQQGIGICLIGNFDETSPSPAQLAAVKRLVTALKGEYTITADRVVGHKTIRATACPGKYFPLAEVSQGLPGYFLSHHDEHPADGPPVRLVGLHGSLQP